MATATVKINDSEFEVSEAVAAALGAERATTKLKMDSLRTRKDGKGKKKYIEPPESEEEMMDGEDMEEMMDEDDEEEDWEDEAEFMEAEPPKSKAKGKKKMDSRSIPALQGRIDALTEYVAELEEQISQGSTLRTDSDEFRAAVDRRCAAIIAATAILGTSTKFDGYSDREILEAAFAEVSDEDISDRSDDYIQGKLDALIEASDGDRADSPLAAAMAGSMSQEKRPTDLASVQKAQCKRWMQPLKAVAK